MIVLDSSFLVAFHNARDHHHQAARQVMERLLEGVWGRALVPEYVFLEVMTVLLARRGLDVAVRVGETLLRAREVDFLPCSELFLDTFEAFRGQGARGLSFADAAIVAIARKLDVRHVATFDADFHAMEGITVVPQ